MEDYVILLTKATTKTDITKKFSLISG